MTGVVSMIRAKSASLLIQINRSDTPLTFQIEGWRLLSSARISLLSSAVASDRSEILASDRSRHSFDLAGQRSVTPINSKTMGFN